MSASGGGTTPNAISSAIAAQVGMHASTTPQARLEMWIASTVGSRAFQDDFVAAEQGGLGARVHDLARLQIEDGVEGEHAGDAGYRVDIEVPAQPPFRG